MPDDTAAEPSRAVAALRRELAEARAERDEALARERAIAEVLQVINSSPGDLAPVFEAMLERAMRLCSAAFGVFATYDGDDYHIVATHGLPPELTEFVSRPIRIEPGSLPDRVRRGEDTLQVADITQLVGELRTPGLVAMIELGNARTAAWVALRKDGVAQGFFGAYRQEVRPFSDKQIALLQNFAAQAVIAMENARLLTETRERARDLQEALEYQTATSDVLQVISRSTFDLQPMLDTLVETAARLCAADHAGIYRNDGGIYRWAAGFAGSPETHSREFEQIERAAAIQPGPGTVVGRAALERRAVQITDVMADPLYEPKDDARTGNLHTLLGMPLMRDGEPIGVIGLARCRVEAFSERQVELVRIFADQAVIAIENARLLTETREALEQQTATAEVLGVINSSPGDLVPVFDALLEKAHILCEAAHGHLTIYDGDLFRIVAMHGIDDVSPFLAQPFSAEPSSLQERLLQGERLIHIADVADDTTSPRNARRQMALEAGFRTVIFVPLCKDEVLVGYITAYRREVRPFTDKQIALLQNFAVQAVIAMENARLLGELRQRNDEIAGWNRELEDRVAAQLGELERVGKLKRFLAPQLAELIVARGDEAVLETHRRDIVVVFCDLRDFTAFAETAEPEEVLDLLREYHAALGPIVSASEGTLDHFSGDGIMVFFNDPVPVADASERAVAMATRMREAMEGLQAQWRRQGRRIGFGAGIARGYATLGQIGFADRIDYTAIGTVCNLAARLCAEAKDGQILISQRVAAAVEERMPLDEIGEVTLKGLREPVAVYNVPLAAASPPHPSLSPNGGEG